MGNTGKRIVNTLVLWDVTDNVTTGTTKPNLPGDPNYISPGTDLTACPVTPGLACPVIKIAKIATGTVKFEFSLAQVVLNNTNVVKVSVGIYVDGGDFDDSVATLDFTDFNPNYLTGQFEGLAAGDYAVGIRYLNGSNVTLATCNDLATITLSGLPPMVYVVTLYGKLENTIGGGGVAIQTSTDGVTWFTRGVGWASTSCVLRATLTGVPSGTTIYVRVIAGPSSPVKFGGNIGISCPVADTDCSDSFVVSADTAYSLTVKVVSSAVVGCP